MKFSKRFLPVLFLGMIAVIAVAFQVDTKDWSRFVTKDGNLSLMLPKNWSTADQNDPKLKETMEKLARDNPDMAAMFKSNQSNESMQFMAYNVGDKDLTDGMDSMNVVVSANHGFTEKMYDDFGKDILNRLELTGKTGKKIVDVPAGKVLTYWGTTVIQLNGGTITMDIFGAFFVKGDKMFTITISLGKDGLKKQRSMLDQIVKTIKI